VHSFLRHVIALNHRLFFLSMHCTKSISQGNKKVPYNIMDIPGKNRPMISSRQLIRFHSEKKSVMSGRPKKASGCKTANAKDGG
jgi:hypothetical protein